MIQALLKILVMAAVLALGGFIWFMFHVFRVKGFNGIWKIMLKVAKDKHWHYHGCYWGFAILIIADLIFDLWRWVPITIIQSLAFGKEAYDLKIGKEKKWDWMDLIADQIGIGLAWLLIRLVLLFA